MIAPASCIILLITCFLHASNASIIEEHQSGNPVDCSDAVRELCWDYMNNVEELVSCTKLALDGCSEPRMLYNKLGPDMDCENVERKVKKRLCFGDRCI